MSDPNELLHTETAYQMRCDELDVARERIIELGIQVDRAADRIAEWKEWHRELSAALGCGMVERSLTMNRATELRRMAAEGITEQDIAETRPEADHG